MENNKITVEESSRIPPTCFPASQMLDNIDNITFSSIWYILLNRINIEILTNWLEVQSNNQYTVKQTILTVLTIQHEIINCSELVRFTHICSSSLKNDKLLFDLNQTVYFAIILNESQSTFSQLRGEALVHTIQSQVTVRQTDNVWERYRINKFVLLYLN